MASAAPAADVVVNDTEDVLHSTGCAVTGTGTCSLRDALTYANANPGPDLVSLGGQAFQPTSPLPTITDDGLTLYGLGGGIGGSFSISSKIDGSLAGPSDGLTISASGCSIWGLLVVNFEGTGIVVRGNTNSFLLASGGRGTVIFFYPVGVQGNRGHGVEVRGGVGNRLNAVWALSNGGNGIFIHGGASANVVAPAPSPTEHPYVTIYGNGLSGIRIGNGVADPGTERNAIGRVSSNWGNGGLAVDLGGDCPTANDPMDADAGPNGLQNFPVISSSSFNNDGTALTITGNIEGAPNATLSVRFYTARGFDDGAFVGETTITTDALGSAPFTTSLALYGTANQAYPVRGIATDTLGNSSEFGPRPAEAVPANLSFFTTTPCRLVDSREQLGGPLKSGIPLPLVVAGQCGVPATARAVVLNVTVTNATADGHLRFSSEAPLCRAATSTINFAAGQTRANHAIVTLEAGGLLAYPAIANAGTIDLVLDVSGYFQ